MCFAIALAEHRIGVKGMRITTVGQNETYLRALLQAMVQQGYRVTHKIDSEELLLNECRRLQCDLVVMLVQRPGAQLIEAIRLLQIDSPKPIVLFAEQTDEKLTDLVVKAGVASYVVDGFDAARLKNIIDTAVLRYSELQNLKDELIRTKLTLVERKQIERAKGILMKQKSMDEEQAYQTLRQAAMSQNKRMIDVANNIIDVADMLS